MYIFVPFYFFVDYGSLFFFRFVACVLFTVLASSSDHPAATVLEPGTAMDSSPPTSTCVSASQTAVVCCPAQPASTCEAPRIMSTSNDKLNVIPASHSTTVQSHDQLLKVIYRQVAQQLHQQHHEVCMVWFLVRFFVRSDLFALFSLSGERKTPYAQYAPPRVQFLSISPSRESLPICQGIYFHALTTSLLRPHFLLVTPFLLSQLLMLSPPSQSEIERGKMALSHLEDTVQVQGQTLNTVEDSVSTLETSLGRQSEALEELASNMSEQVIFCGPFFPLGRLRSCLTVNLSLSRASACE